MSISRNSHSGNSHLGGGGSAPAAVGGRNTTVLLPSWEAGDDASRHRALGVVQLPSWTVSSGGRDGLLSEDDVDFL